MVCFACNYYIYLHHKCIDTRTKNQKSRLLLIVKKDNWKYENKNQEVLYGHEPDALLSHLGRKKINRNSFVFCDILGQLPDLIKIGPLV